MTQKNEIQVTERIDALFERIANLIEQARQHVYRTVNVTEVKTRFEVGRYIFEDEQQGGRAAYGARIMQNLSQRLLAKYGTDWTIDTLTRCRTFFVADNNPAISATPLPKLQSIEGQGETKFSNSVAKIQQPKFVLTWSHYLVLMRIENPDELSFYEIECAREQWSVRQLKRQHASSLYERLALSRDKDEVMRLSREGQTIEKPQDIIKDPVTLEFLGLKPDTAYSESKLENAIISKLQNFLLEMGKGFLFEARQKRFTFEERNFYVDLVLYNRLLQCYVLVDLKIDDLTHQDLGQMQMYVNYYDRYVKEDFEHPTIGILLCKEKSDALVELTLPKDANIYATQYQLYLPDKALLQSKVKEWIEEYNEANPETGLDGQLDELILTTNDDTANGKLEDCARMLFPQEGETTPRLRFKGFEGEWEKKLLSDCLEISDEKNTDNLFGIEDVLSVSDENGVVNQIEHLGRSYAGKSVSGYKILRPGQIVYTKSPLRAKPYGIVKHNTGKAGIVSVLYAVYNPKEGVAPEYIHYYFDPAWRLNAYMRPLVNKGAKNTMNISDETALTGYIMIPKDIEEQKRIASFLQRLDDQMKLHQHQFERLKQLKSACLDSMFPQQSENTPPYALKALKVSGWWLS